MTKTHKGYTKVKLSELPEGHLFVHGVYIWNKKKMGDDIGGIRAIKSGKETLWQNINPDTLVFPVINAVIKDKEITIF